MIAYFPALYPDELLYSQLARYYMASGYIAYTFAAEDLFQSKTVRPSLEFVNQFTLDAVKAMTKNISMEQIVQRHTMFPYYGRFLKKERRKNAYSALISMKGNYHNLLPIPQNKDGRTRYLRYCPLCAAGDREKYGETYWHRIHQMIGVCICPIHCCKLIDSNVIFKGKASPSLKTAEEIIPLTESILFSNNELECRVAKYIKEVFQSGMDLESEVTVGKFLHSKMANTKYCSIRGEQRNISLFHTDFIEFYKDMPGNWLTELWQLQKILTDDRINTYEICLMALFLNITVDELVHMKLPKKSQQQLFDEEIYSLHKQGLKYPEIAEILNASYQLVKSIGEGRYRTYHTKSETPIKSGVKSRDWKKIDEDTLPLVKKTIQQLHGDRTSRPKKITVTTIEKILYLPCKQIQHHLPKCHAEIQKYKESQEQYWAREVIWAARQIIDSGTSLGWGKIHRLTNMRRENFEVCIPYVSDYCDQNLVQQIMQLL